MKIRANFALTKTCGYFAAHAVRLSYVVLLALCSVWGMFGWAAIAQAGTNITLPFSSTFNCPESVQSSWGSMDDIAGCPGWQGNGAWTTSAGSGDRISSQDNNPSGGSGRGFGAAVGDGHNNAGGRIIAAFAEQPELWVRFYMKYPAGFSWVNGEPEWQKILRFRGPTNSDVVFQFRDWTGAELSFYLPGTISTNVGGSCGWTCIMGGSTGDGVWHLYEVHVKRGNPGILEAWVDGNRIFINTTTHVADSGFTSLQIVDNQNAPNNGGDRYISVDDIAISTTGYIGPIGGGLEILLPPINFRIIN